MTDGVEFHPRPADVPPINPNTCQDIAFRFAVALAAVIVLVGLWIAFVTPARAQAHKHPPQDSVLHEQFYASWMRLDGMGSCCNNEDCFPTIMIQGRDGKWYALRKPRMTELKLAAAGGGIPRMPLLDEIAADGLRSWVQVPDDRIEHNARRPDLDIKAPRDPRDSPDGRSHACIGSSNFVYCAVVGDAT